ncbi:MAG: cell wall metabolism sensor histidine kinase WalK, partial [Dehalococcoidia bacterium]|nr:cell wall metabolism sensor histidine kinase WalK [Dehalococcoidia bacterium]
NQMASDLETQRELRRRLINDVSHELNTPLSVIQLEAQGLSDGLQTAESASDHIVQEVGRLRGLVTDLNSLAETDYGELRLRLDLMRMSQALGNVVSNAIRCTEAGGSIVINARLESHEALAVSITDDGIGIDAADLPHVFERFYRTDESRSREIGGTGLGLAITRAIVEAHGGTVGVASDGPGQGATVTIRLPLNEGISSA